MQIEVAKKRLNMNAGFAGRTVTIGSNDVIFCARNNRPAGCLGIMRPFEPIAAACKAIFAGASTVGGAAFGEQDAEGNAKRFDEADAHCADS